MLAAPFAAFGLVVAWSTFTEIVVGACMLIRYIPSTPGLVAAALLVTSIWLGGRIGWRIVNALTHLPNHLSRRPPETH